MELKLVSMQNICVYCASSTQVKPIFFEVADHLGKILASENIQLIYGGGSMGLMEQVADSTLRAGGKVTGVIPEFMCAEKWNHVGLKERFLHRSPSLTSSSSSKSSEKSLSVTEKRRKEQNRTEHKRIESSFFFFLTSFIAMWESADTTTSNAAGFNSQTSFYEYPSHKPFINSIHPPLRSAQTISRTVALPESNRDNLLTALQSLTLRIKKLEHDLL